MQSEIKGCPCCNGAATPSRAGIKHLVFCTECKLRTEAYDTREAAIAAWNRRADGWVRVEDGLPEKYGYYLVVCNAPTPKTMEMLWENVTVYGKDRWRWNWHGRVNSWTVTRWRPMPEPPKEDADD